MSDYRLVKNPHIKVSKGDTLKSEQFHSRVTIPPGSISLWDRVRLLFGANISVSYCFRIEIVEHDGKYQFAKPVLDDCHLKGVVWRKAEEIAEIEAKLGFAKIPSLDDKQASDKTEGATLHL